MNFQNLITNTQIAYTMKSTIIEMGDFFTTMTTAGVEIEIELEDHGDTDTNGHIIAEYTILVVDMLNYKIINKRYAEHLTIKETKECDEYIARAYENNYFEDAIVGAHDEEDECGWFI